MTKSEQKPIYLPAKKIFISNSIKIGWRDNSKAFLIFVLPLNGPTYKTQCLEPETIMFYKLNLFLLSCLMLFLKLDILNLTGNKI